MNTLLFPIALMLPWLAGAMALRPLRERLGLTLSGWLGYSYFLGAALVTASAFLTSLFPWLATTLGLIGCLATLSLVCTLGANQAAQRLPAATPLALSPATRGERWITALILALIALHLAFAAFELYWRPVYPWDAWQTWMYTAKAWYFSGMPVDMLHPHQWLNLPDNGAYTVQGHRYPWLPPAQSWWLASVMGTWQENRVSWPAFPAALALGLALWGQAVAATGQRLAGPLAAFLLLSLPLLNTHIALAGYADLWLAGFSGLGLIAIARGLLEAHRGQLLLGLVALSLGILVKHDAIIWLTCGILLIGLLRLPGAKSMVLALSGALIVGLLTISLSPIDLKLNSGFLSYGDILWLFDSWHLLWYLLPGSFLLALLTSSKPGRMAKVLGLLLALILASQLMLFGATSAGSWIVTAASRLLLQVSPVLIFTLACLFGTSAKAVPHQQRWRSAAALLAGSICLLVALSAWFLYGQTEGPEPTPAFEFKAHQLRAVDGPIRQSQGQLQLPPANEGHAIISTGPLRLNAADYAFLSVDIDGAGQSKHTLFWRTAAQPSQPFSRPISFGSGITALHEDKNWRGDITEIGIVLYANPNQPLTLRALTVEAKAPSAMVRLTANDWLTPKLWTQSSINRTKLSATGLPSLPLLTGLWLILCGAALHLFTTAMPLRPLLGLALFAWLVLDARWLHNCYYQALATQAHYTSTIDPEALEIPSDAATLELARQARAILGEEPRQVLLAAETSGSFIARRLKYALLPHAAHIHTGRITKRRVALLDAVIWLSNGPSAPHTQCPPPLQHIKPALVTTNGVMCIIAPRPQK